MKLYQDLEWVIGIEDPWKIRAIELDKAQNTVNIEIEFIKSLRPKAAKCPECGGECSYYDMVEKSWRHTDICDSKCIIHGMVPRTRCKSCGKVRVMKTPWAADSINKYTNSFEAKVVRLSKEMPVSAVCKELRLDDSTVWTILERYVDRCMQNQDLDYVNTYYADEKAIEKGHVYLTTFLDQFHNVVFVGKDNTCQTVADFKEHLESHNGCAGNIRHISQDMGSGYIKGANEYFPNAKITYDHFHVIEHATEAVNDTRKREYAQLQKANDEEGMGLLKGQRYLFITNYKNLDEDKQEKVRGLLGLFPDLGRVYTFKESLRAVWEMDSKYDADCYLTRWLKEAEDTGIQELLKLVNLIESHKQGILNWYDSKINNGVMEGFNSVLQAFKGRARGYRSFERYRTMIYLRSSGLC